MMFRDILQTDFSMYSNLLDNYKLPLAFCFLCKLHKPRKTKLYNPGKKAQKGIIFLNFISIYSCSVCSSPQILSFRNEEGASLKLCL